MFSPSIGGQTRENVLGAKSTGKLLELPPQMFFSNSTRLVSSENAYSMWRENAGGLEGARM